MSLRRLRTLYVLLLDHAPYLERTRRKMNLVTYTPSNISSNVCAALMAFETVNGNQGQEKKQIIAGTYSTGSSDQNFFKFCR